MVKQVIKRDGRLVKFSRTKIVNAIQSAMEESGDMINLDVANEIALGISGIDKEVLNVDEIHKQVEKGLSKNGFIVISNLPSSETNFQGFIKPFVLGNFSTSTAPNL